MPLEAHSPQPWGKRVGGVSGRPMRATGRSNPSAYPGRNGGRHPGSRDAGNLRGLTEKRGSWPVRLVCAGLVPMQAVAPATAGVLWKNEEGNVVSMRQAHALVADTPNKRLHEGGHVLHSVQRPVHVTRLSSSLSNSPEAAQAEVGEGTQRLRYRGRATPRKWDKPAPGSGSLDACAARRASPLLSLRSRSARRSCVTRQKRKVVMAIVPARKREPRAQCPYVVVRCRSRQAASWPRISSHAAPQKGWRYE
jgi:hypothetical protein